MDKFDRYEPCPACGNYPEDTGLMWKPKFHKGGVETHVVWNDNGEELLAGTMYKHEDTHTVTSCYEPHLEVFCGQCKYSMKRGCVNEV